MPENLSKLHARLASLGARREASPKGYRFAYAKAYRSTYPLGRSHS